MLDIGPAEFIGLALVALIVFGPERLPMLAADAGRLLRQVRQLVDGAKHELHQQLAPELSDVHLPELNPHRLASRIVPHLEEYAAELPIEVNSDASRLPPATPPLPATDPQSERPPSPSPPELAPGHIRHEEERPR